MVLLSVLSLMLILSVLVSSAGRQMHWLLQTTTQATNQARTSRPSAACGALFALDVGFDGRYGQRLRRWIAPDACVRFYPQVSAEFIWRFTLMEQQAMAPARTRWGLAAQTQRKTSCGGSALA